MNLAQLQRYFAAAVTSGSGPVRGLDDVFTSDERLAASERLAIYNRAFYYRQLDALASVFGQTRRVFGETAFERLGLAYLAQYPSEHPALERVGRHFARYLASLGSQPAEPLADLALLEWTRLCALVAPDPAALAEPNAVAPAVFPHCRLKFVPALFCIELDARALSAFAGRDSSGEPGDRCAVAVWRAGHVVSHEPLESMAFHALEAARGGATLSEVCASFDTGNEAADVQSAYRTVSAWYARHWLESVESAGS